MTEQRAARYVGIDLGTTNSAACVWDGERNEVVRSAQGGVLTPSVVRIDARGNTLVGSRARRFLESDPDNTRAEFKRLMGTSHRLSFAAAKVEKSPEELAAIVLAAIRSDVQQAIGIDPTAAVITVPALFELPQSRATAEAARLAGFESVELLQEPVASALASGWKADESEKPWLVYDLGGGTFDASLLETREGMLRVVGHDGDNFLGGRDIDGKMVEAVLAHLAEQGTAIDRRDPAHASALRRLRLLCEEAKVDAGRGSEALIVAPGLFAVGSDRIDVDVAIPHGEFKALVLSLIDRSIAVCIRLLQANGLTSAQLGRVVLVGGPTVMPLVREHLADRLGAPITPGLDPMTLVAEGAALFAGSMGISATSGATKAAATASQAGGGGGGGAATSAPSGIKVWLQYSAITSDPSPHIVGKVIDTAAGVAKVQLRRVDGS